MPRQMTKAGVKAFRQRWEVIAEAERAELEAVAIADKFRQFTALVAGFDGRGWGDLVAEQEAEVRNRWIRLRRRLRRG